FHPTVAGVLFCTSFRRRSVSTMISIETYDLQSSLRLLREIRETPRVLLNIKQVLPRKTLSKVMGKS
ncbi:hypothetical protein, partial [Allochromatium humboldtianum]|uniref:hypothetical protein n=1 Tax=Allochromatium humboldtianum TaxID=504901 RepID=UPI001CA407CC